MQPYAWKSLSSPLSLNSLAFMSIVRAFLVFKETNVQWNKTSSSARQMQATKPVGTLVTAYLPKS